MEHFYNNLEQHAVKNPDAPFLVTSEQILNFGEVRDLGKKLATHFRELGIRPGDIVGLDLPAAIGVIFTMTALHEGVVTYVGAGGTSTLTQKTKHLFTTNQSVTSEHFTVSIVDSSFFRDIDGYSKELEPIGFESEDSLCRLVFSSGTTGDPKPISLTVSMVENRALAAGELRRGDEAFLCTLNVGSSSGFHTLICCLKDGLPYLVPGNAQENLKLLHKHAVSAIKASPFQIRELLVQSEKLGYQLEALKDVYSAGASVPKDLVQMIESRQGLTLHNLYGSSEAGRGAERVLASSDLGWVGYVVDGTDLQIVDEKHEQLPVGSTGAVRYRRAHQAVEYFGEPELTAKVFHDGWFYTGDLGRLDGDGRLVLEGRTSGIMNIAGVKVNPESVVQNILARPGVLDAVAFEYKPLQGQNEFGVALQVEHDFDFDVLARELKQQFGAAAPAILFSLPELPRNAAGKAVPSEVSEIYRKALESN